MRDYELLAQVGRRVRAQREALSMTRDQLADIVGVSVNFCSDIELGKKGMSIETLAKLARALHVSIDYIILGQSNATDTRFISMMLESCDSDKAKYLEEIIKNFILATKRV